MMWPPGQCANCEAPLWLDDVEDDGYHCRVCDEWYYRDQIEEAKP